LAFSEELQTIIVRCSFADKILDILDESLNTDDIRQELVSGILIQRGEILATS
jgi:hypothetical protein